MQKLERNISHLGKGNIIFRSALVGNRDMLLPRMVHKKIIKHLHKHLLSPHLERNMPRNPLPKFLRCQRHGSQWTSLRWPFRHIQTNGFTCGSCTSHAILMKAISTPGSTLALRFHLAKAWGGNDKSKKSKFVCDFSTTNKNKPT